MAPFALLDSVRIHRNGDHVVIEFVDEPVSVRLRLGLAVRHLTDQEVLDRFNRRVLALAEGLVSAPQLAWDDAGGRWRPLGRALRGAVDGPVVVIDDIELNHEELGHMLEGHGAGLCILFLDD